MTHSQTIEGAPLLSILTKDDEEDIDIELKERLISEFESNIPFITNIQSLDQLSFHEDISKFEKEHKSNRIKQLIASWTFSIFYWLSVLGLIYFIKLCIADSSMWIFVFWFAIFTVLFISLPCSVSLHPGLTCDALCDGNFLVNMHTMYSWQRKMSGLIKNNVIYDGKIFPFYYIEWKAPDGQKYSNKKFFRDPPNKEEDVIKNYIYMDDISNDLNATHINDTFENIKDQWFVEVTIYKTYTFKDEAVKNKYIKQGKEFIDQILMENDFDECEDIKLYQGVSRSGTKPVKCDMFAKQTYYVIDNDAGRMKICGCNQWIIRLLGLWCIFDTVVYYQTR